MIRLINCLEAWTGRVQTLGSAYLAVQDNYIFGARVLVCQHQYMFTKGSLLAAHLTLLHQKFSSNRAFSSWFFSLLVCMSSSSVQQKSDSLVTCRLLWIGVTMIWYGTQNLCLNFVILTCLYNYSLQFFLIDSNLI
jgi:hypothetical protein